MIFTWIPNENPSTNAWKKYTENTTKICRYVVDVFLVSPSVKNNNDWRIEMDLWNNMVRRPLFRATNALPSIVARSGLSSDSMLAWRNARKEVYTILKSCYIEASLRGSTYLLTLFLGVLIGLIASLGKFAWLTCLKAFFTSSSIRNMSKIPTPMKSSTNG